MKKDRRPWNAKTAMTAKGRITSFFADIAHSAFDVVCWPVLVCRRWASKRKTGRVMRNWKALVRARLNPLPLDPLRESEIVDELAQHVAQHYGELVAAGVPEAEAIEQALAPLADHDRVASELASAARRTAVQYSPEPPVASINLF